MDDIMQTIDHPIGVSEDIAIERIIGFAEQFGRAHLDLACHAAFPLVLTPDMLYQIWASFVQQAPWTAVADILLSPLCSEVAYELYEMDTTIRNVLLKQLRGDARFGQPRLDQMAVFLQQYVEPLANSDNLGDQNLAEAQQWAALVYTQPSRAVEQIVGAFQNLDQQNAAEALRLTSLVKTFTAPMEEVSEYRPLLVYAISMETLLRGDRQGAIARLNTVADKDGRVEVTPGFLLPNFLFQPSKESTRQQREVFEKTPLETGYILNPYIAGPVLDLGNSVFVGRHDLIQVLYETLSKERFRPLIMLNGERRMGKSSLLRQMPLLLDANYLTIYFDLYAPAMLSSVALLLGTLAGGIEEMVVSRGMRVKKLEVERLQEVSMKNEADVYHVFDVWLMDLERVLEQEDRTLLLAFDGFERLEEARQENYLDLELLLNWFRSVIQNHPRLALLFSGVRSFEDMGTNWAGYFVNVQTLKVSFLQPAEAYQLITRPVPRFPGQDIYGDGVVERILTETGCHPFLVQAICSALIDNLNAENRDQAEIADVTVAMNQVLESWWDTYFRDLWERTDQEQRRCLIAVKHLGIGNLQSITQQSSLDERTVRRALQTLIKRDLIVLEQLNYRIATPIFGEWVERNNPPFAHSTYA